jgi:hypothetical protein
MTDLTLSYARDSEISSTSAVTGYLLQRATTADFASPIDLNAGPGMTAFTDNGLAPGTTYWYRARAVNGNAVSEWSPAVQATTKGRKKR